MKQILLLSLLFFVTITQAASFTSSLTGLWNSGPTWGNVLSIPGVDYPAAGDDATISNGNTVFITGTEICNTLTISSTASTTELAFFTGSLTATSVALISSGGESKIGNISGGTITVNTGALILNQSGAGLCSFNIPLGAVSVTGDITVTNTAVANTIIDMSGGSASFNFGGNFAGANDLTMTGGSGGSTFTFDGSVLQTTGTSNTAIVFDNLTMANSHLSGVVLDGALSAANLGGVLTLASGVFNDGGFSIDYIGDISNPGTFINSGTINLTGSLINSGTFNASGTIDLSGDFTNSGTFTSSGCNINLQGDWDNTLGTYTYFDGDIVTFDGGFFLDQEISGTTSWFNLTVAKGSFASTLSLTSGTQNIHNIFNINSGAVSNTGASVVLISDAVRTAQMDDIGTGSYSGDMTVQRRIAKAQQSFISIGSPVSGTTLASYSDDNILYTGTGPGTFTGANFENFGWHNTYWYDESAADGVMNNGFTAAGTTAQAVGVSNNFRAFHIYTDAVTYNLDVTGVPNMGTVNIPLQYDGAFAGNQAGWNLIANPYPCTIDWESIHGGGLGTLINGYFVYNDGLSNYDYYDGTTGFPLVGATQFIPHTQGFWVRSTGLTSLSISESDKSTTDQAFYKSSNGSYIRIALSGDVNTFGDAAVIIERDDYTENYDVDVDIQKFLTLDPDNAPSLYTTTPDGYDLCFNKIADESISIPLVAKAGALAQGDYTLDFDIPSTFMLGACITLEDLHTGIITDLRSDSSYSYITSDTTTLPRFIIHVVKDFNTSVVDLTCFGSANGAVTIDGVGITGSIFELLDGAGNAVFTGSAANDVIEFLNIPAGEYELATNHIGSCSSGNFYISVIEPTQVTANFDLVEDTIYLDQGGLIAVTNLSSATNYVWDFGDGNTSSDENPTHVYTASGVYQVMLTSDNDNVGQCSEVTSRNAVVMNTPLSFDDMQFIENTNAFVSNGKVVVDFALENHTNVEIILVDVTGKIILSNEYTISNGRIDLVNTDEVSSGVYFVNITIEGQRKSQKLFID